MKHETTTFPLIPVDGTFTKQFDGRTLTYVKIDDYKARVKHDPKGKYVGCVYVIAWNADVQTQRPFTRREVLNLHKIGLEPAEVSLR